MWYRYIGEHEAAFDIILYARYNILCDDALSGCVCRSLVLLYRSENAFFIFFVCACDVQRDKRVVKRERERPLIVG